MEWSDIEERGWIDAPKPMGRQFGSTYKKISNDNTNDVRKKAVEMMKLPEGYLTYRQTCDAILFAYPDFNENPRPIEEVMSLFEGRNMDDYNDFELDARRALAKIKRAAERPKPNPEPDSLLQ